MLDSRGFPPLFVQGVFCFKDKPQVPMFKETAAKLSAEQLEKNFADIAPSLTPSQALEQGSRCLFCYDAPCIKACPTGIDVPQFIRQILTGNLKGSAKTILDANILGHSCGRVCPTSVLCEGACVLNIEGKRPVDIGRLQRHAVDHVIENHIQLFHAAPATGRTVALVGGGPASLACAAELRKFGHAAIIFDAHAQPGGLDTYGIAAYKMRAADVMREIEMIRDLGVEIRQSIEVGHDITLQQLETDHDAIFLAVGLGVTDTLNIPGEELAGCRDALSFIEETKTKDFSDVEIGRRVAVIGGGNTAIDVVTAAKRLGAEQVYMVYRRGREEMSAFGYEYDLAIHDAVTFVWDSMPMRIIGNANGQIEALECARTELGPSEASGKRAVRAVSGTEFRLDVDMVVKALGQKRKIDFLTQINGLELKDGCVVVDLETMQTGNPKYFAGGDCVNGGGEVVDAVAHGKRAALAIHEQFRAFRTERRTHA
jgi:dihydropyrimidine dehydrogenase (NAD+) subunit PreT